MPVPSSLVSPIDALPVEVLCAIFAVDQPEHSMDISYYDWIAQTTWVCHRWRRAALGCSSLWAFASTDLGPRWLQEMSSRSRKLPLTLKMDLSVGRRPPANLSVYIETLARQAYRLKELILLVDSISFLKASSALCTPAPLLESLQIESVEDCKAPFAPRLPDILFDCPNLRDVDLIGCLLPSGLTWPSGISSLSLGWAHQDSERITFDELVHALRAMPQLVFLQVDHCIYLDFDTSAVDNPVHLSMLERFCLNSDCLDSIRILNSLRFPTSCSLAVTELTFTEEDELCGLGDALQSCWLRDERSGAPPFKTMLIEQFDEEGIHLFCWPAAVDPHAVQHDLPFFELNIYPAIPDCDSEEFFDAFLSTFPLKQFQRIYDGRPTSCAHDLELEFPAFGSMESGFIESIVTPAGLLAPRRDLM